MDFTLYQPLWEAGNDWRGLREGTEDQSQVQAIHDGYMLAKLVVSGGWRGRM